MAALKNVTARQIAGGHAKKPADTGGKRLSAKTQESVPKPYCFSSCKPT